MSLITEHNDRHQSPGVSQGVWFDDALSVYVTQDLSVISAILRSPDWVVAYREPVDRILGDTMLGAQTRYDTTRFAFENLPLANEGDRHSQLRRAFALRLAAHREELEVSLPGVLAPMVDQALSKPSADLVGEIVLPLVRHILQVYGAPEHVDETVSVSQVLDPLISLGRRQRIEKSLTNMRADLAAAGDGLTEAEIAQGLSFQILGGDSLAGSLSASLFAVLDAHPGWRLCDIDWPEHIAGTGVPYIARRCTRAMRVNAYDFEEGAFIRLYLRQFAGLARKANAETVFGIGRHVCPGKNISLRIWAIMADVLARRAESVRVRSYRWRSSDYVFDHLDELVLDVHG
ncbi:MAG: hypothetical protein AAF940_06335 [Pseudomonadota bacterium]